jgi:hypothetical protein
LDDFGIPLLLSHTITWVAGNQRIEGVKVAKVDANKKPIPETERFYKCDTLLLSVGLIPENELSRQAAIVMDPVTNGPVVNQYMQTSVSSIFACGNVVHVNDLVDNVSRESEIAGREAARYALKNLPKIEGTVSCRGGVNVRYVCPHQIGLNAAEDQEIALYFRVSMPQVKVRISVKQGDRKLADKKVLKVNPGEIEHMIIKSKYLRPGDLTVNAVQGEA